MPSEINSGKTFFHKAVADPRGGTLSQISEIKGFCVQD